MASPISTGGSGIHFESHVGAYFLATTLTGGAVRGLPSGSTSTNIKFQRAFEGSPLDDVIVGGGSMAGPATLSLQVKRTFTFGDNDLFHEVIAQCWATFKKPGFRAQSDRFGVAIATTTGNFEQAGRNVLTWARQSTDSTDFLHRIAARKHASDGMRTFLGTIRNGLNGAAGTPIDDEDVWQFLRHFVVLHFDFEHDEASDSRIEVIERLRYALSPDDNDRALDLWRALVEIVDAAKPAAGSVDRTQLIERLASNFQLAPLRQWLPAIEKLREVSSRAIDDIKTDIGGVHLTRRELLEKFDDQLNTDRFIEVVGEAGSGKSALLRGLATRKAEEGPVLFLKASRMPGNITGWEGLASLWRLDIPLNELIAELSCVDAPCLFIDGIERISQPGGWLAVNDILKDIHRSKASTRWRVLVSTRSNSLAYRTHLTLPEAVQIKRLTVGDLNDEEITEICTFHPKLARLAGEKGRAREIAARPYLLDRLTRIVLPYAASDTPLSEIDLMIQIWTSCANLDQDSEQLVMTRQDVLIAIGRQRLAQPNRHLTSVGLSSEALTSLIRDELLHHDLVTRELAFAHDIVEDWVLCQTLRHESRSIAEVVNALGQPLWLLDPIQLLAQWHIETENTLDSWHTLLNCLSSESMQPRWRRAVLTSILRSARADHLLQKAAPALWENDAKLLKELMISVRTLEVEPNPKAFDTALIPNFNDAERLELAHSWAIPRLQSWRHFLPWFIPQLDSLSPVLVEETTKVLGTFCDAFHFFPKWAGKPIARFSRKWLAYMEQTDEMDYDELSKRLKAMGVHYDDAKKLRTGLRKLLINTVDGAPEEVAEHLSTIATSKRPRGTAFFIEFSNRLVEQLPSELVDFLLTVMLHPWGENPYDRNSVMSFNELGIKHEHLFFPASHLRPPFLALLRHAPEHGIRLINSLCNHAMQVWRNILQYERSGTPLPLTLTFGWGTKEFWGHAREYTWFRAIGPGPYPVESALMALEVWMEEQIAADCDPETLFRQVLEGNDCIGTVGACIAIAMANQQKCLKAALPFITSPRLQEYDIRRRVQDGRSSMSNLIGLPKDRPFLEEVAKRNLLPYRQLILRDLIGSYLFNTNAELGTEFTQRINAISEDNLPFDFAEQRTDEAIAEELRGNIQRLKAMATLGNWKIGQEIENGFTIEYCPPPELAISEEFMAEQDQQQKAMQLAMWAEKNLEEQRLSDGINLSDAIALAHELDTENLFDSPATDTDFHLKNRRGAVVGVAAMTARFADELTPEILNWIKETLYRALGTPLETSSFLYEASEVVFDPHVLSVDGLTALVKRGLSDSEDDETLLTQVCHPLHKVIKTVFKGLSACWENKPLLCWQAFALGMRLSVMPWPVLHTRRGNIGLYRTDEEIEWLQQELDEVLADFKAGQRSSLPDIPPPWDDSLDPDMSPHALKRSEMAFLWHIAPIVLVAQPLQQILGNPEQRQGVLNLVQGLVGWTILDAVPPGGRQLHHQRAYEWGMTFMDWCAQLTAHLTADEAEELIITPIAEVAEERNGEHLLEYFLRSFILHRLGQNEVPDETTMRIWVRLCNTVIQHRSARGACNHDFVRTGYGSCVVSLIFAGYGRSQFEHPWPALHIFTPGVERWTGIFGTSPAYFGYWAEFMLHAGRGLLPSPALGWLHTITLDRRDDGRFWQAHGNGDKAAALLSMVLDDHGQQISEYTDWLQQTTEVADHLVKHGVRLAAQVQQRLAGLQKR